MREASELSIDAIGCHCSKQYRRPAFSYLRIGRQLGTAGWTLAMINRPVCRSERIHQSRLRSVMERKILALIFVQPFRCIRHNLRFFRWSFGTNPNPSWPAATQ
jgi:hypothetical protein